MKYTYTPAKRERHTVTFWQDENPHIFEAGSAEDQYFLSQDVKSWLVKNGIKVFVSYNCGDMGGGTPEFTIEFLSEQEARQFVEEWG